MAHSEEQPFPMSNISESEVQFETTLGYESRTRGFYSIHRENQKQKITCYCPLNLSLQSLFVLYIKYWEQFSMGFMSSATNILWRGYLSQGPNIHVWNYSEAELRRQHVPETKCPRVRNILIKKYSIRNWRFRAHPIHCCLIESSCATPQFDHTGHDSRPGGP